MKEIPQFWVQALRRMGLLMLMLGWVAGQFLMTAPVSAQQPQWYIFQQFQNGIMLANGTTIMVLVNPDKAYEFTKPVYESLTDLIFSGAPPAVPGARQPQGAFGVLWRNLPDLRTTIGWALGPEKTYEAQIGAAAGVYISLPDGRTVKVNLGVLSPPEVSFRLAVSGSISAAFGAWTYTAPQNPPCSSSARRIQFAAGSTAGTVAGVVGPSCPSVSYVLRVRGGQRMAITMQGVVTGSVTYSNGEAYTFGILGTGTGIVFDRLLSVGGDVYVRVNAQSMAETPYTMTVSVVNQPGDTSGACPGLRRIQFSAGSYSATVTGSSTAACLSASFVLRALAGQRMIIQVTSGGPMQVIITAPGGGTQSGYANTGTAYDRILPVTGDYYIRLVEDSRYAAWIGQYSLTVTIY